ncbi:MAG: adenylate kinase [Lentimicrobiaceae bacterium]|jgi:adenylate kinase|nr:adenylate kinase [Lentimicrobiaceae bacterium]
MLNIIIFGAPGAGKGTQSVKIASHYNLVHVSTGDILRNEIKQQSALGAQAKTFMDKGELVPDDLLIAIINSVMMKNQNTKGIILDGFPRTKVQAQALDNLLDTRKTPVSAVIALEADEEELIARLLNRALELGRADDKEDVIRQRLEVYNKQTSPLIDYYRLQGKFIPVKGVGSVDEIFDNLCKIINTIK